MSGLRIEKNGNGNSSNYGKGIYIGKAKIISVEDVSGKLVFPTNPDYAPDLAIKVTFDIGSKFTPSDTIHGNFKKDEVSGKVTGWGGAFKVSDFLLINGVEGELTEDNKLTEAQLKQLIGKEVLRLTYVKGSNLDSGKAKYQNWDIYIPGDANPQELADRFFKSLSTGFPKNYRPEVIDEVKDKDTHFFPIPDGPGTDVEDDDDPFL